LKTAHLQSAIGLMTPSSTPDNKRAFSTSTSKGGWGSLVKKSKASPKSL
jgi:hypothetical protein